MSLKYGPFEYSTGVVAGYHTGTAQFVDKDFADRPVVHFHEGVHGRIFNETPDGQFHHFCLRGAGLADSLATEATPLARWLSNDTRIAQERSATYLGISSLEPAKGAVEAAQLVPEYAEYYRFFSSLLDAHLRSTYARYAFAWAMTTWAFSSQRLERLAHDDWFDIAKVQAIEGPTRRMDRIAEVARQGDFATVIRDCISKGGERVARQGIEWADIDDEQEWGEAFDSPKAHAADIALYTAMTTWLQETLGIELFAWGKDNEAAIVSRLKRVHLTPRSVPDSSEAETDFLAERATASGSPGHDERRNSC